MSFLASLERLTFLPLFCLISKKQVTQIPRGELRLTIPPYHATVLLLRFFAGCSATAMDSRVSRAADGQRRNL